MSPQHIYTAPTTPLIMPRPVGVIPEGTARFANFHFSAEMLSALFKPYGFKLLYVVETDRLFATVLLGNLDVSIPPDGLTPTTISYTGLGALPKDTYAAFVTLPLSWATTLLIAGGWSSITPVKFIPSTDTTGVTLTALTGCEIGTVVAAEDPRLPASLPLTRAEFDRAGEAEPIGYVPAQMGMRNVSGIQQLDGLATAGQALNSNPPKRGVISSLLDSIIGAK